MLHSRMKSVLGTASEMMNFDVFLTMHRSIDLFHLPVLTHNTFIH
jgi:hypothetical protein